MFNSFGKSLRNRLLVLFFTIGFLPFLTLLTYTLFLSETKMVDKIVIEQQERAEAVAKLLNNHLASLTKELSFLSSLDLMDDLLAEDIDKRVSRLLTQKASDINLDIEFLAIDVEGNVIASSSKESLLNKFETQRLTSKKGDYIQEKTLYVYSKIYASFDMDQEIACLVLRYNLDNLNLYLTHTNDIHSFIMNQKKSLRVGENVDFELNFTKEGDSLIDSEHVIVYKRLSQSMDEWYLVYGVEKSVALASLYDFIYFMLYVSVFIFFLIVYASFRYSRDIVKPIEELTRITDEITSTQNYSVRLETNSQDEIATLSHSFNKMTQTTSVALEKLEKENKLRVQRFTGLIEVFNTIIQTKSEEECMSISIEQIKKLTPESDLYFVESRELIEDREFIELYVSDFENDKKEYFGSIVLSIKKFEDKYEKNFYNSIASMITLQLDRIRLIQRTMSASNAKSAFISNMSHELRTPLNAIIGYAQYMITYEELKDEQMDTVGNIETSAQYLLEMINEILDVAKIEAGKMEVFKEDIDLLRLLQGSYDMLSPLAVDKELEFSFVHEGVNSCKFHTDPKMFQQIVLNLLSNAIKFTKQGNIVLKFYCDDENIYVSVKDSGIGISKENISKLFNDFTQVQNIMQKTHKGTGLGLSFSRKMANILGGDVSLKSGGLGEGSEATLTLKRED